MVIRNIRTAALFLTVALGSAAMLFVVWHRFGGNYASQALPLDDVRFRTFAETEGEPVKEVYLGESPIIDDSFLAFTKKFDGLRKLSLFAVDVTDAGMANIASLDELRELDIYDVLITDKALQNIANLRKIQVLRLYNTKCTDRGLQYIRDWREIRSLSLRSCEFSDAAIDTIRQFDKIEKLVIDCPKISDDGIGKLSSLADLKVFWPPKHIGTQGLRNLKRLPALEELSLSGNGNVTDESLAELSDLKNLKRLNCAVNLIRGSGLAKIPRSVEELSLCSNPIDTLTHLSHLAHLRLLDLSYTGIRDAELLELERFEHLETLDLCRCKNISDKGVEKLKQTLPNLDINR